LDGSANVVVNSGSQVYQAVNAIAPNQAEVLSQAQVQSQVDSQAQTCSAQARNLSNTTPGSHNFISGDNGLEDISNKIISTIMEYIKPILEPVQVTYSNEVLANQIYGISIFLFILSILIMILLVFFILNILVFIYSDKIMNYFSNKYIK
jgi:hypothetical protein